MNRTVLRVVVLIVAAALLIFPTVTALMSTDEASGPDPVRITDYAVDYVLDADGTLAATETLTTEFPGGRHGIFRFWDLADPSDRNVRLDPEQVRVQLDGADVPFDLQWQQGRKLRVAKIGDPDSTVPPGPHTYTISYVVKGALSPGSAGADSAFYWNVVPQGWQMTIDKATIRMTLPAASGPVQCTSGTDSTGECTIGGAGTDQVTVSTGALPPRTPVTVRVGLPVEAPDRVTVPWPVQADRGLGQSPGILALIVLVTLVLGALTYLLERRSREERPGLPVTYEPPAGLGPVQTAYLTTEEAPGRGLVATLLYQAEQGLTTLTRVDDAAWTVTGVGDEEAWAGTDDITRFVGTSLGVTRPGTTFTASEDDEEAGKTLQTTRDLLGAKTESWADAIGAQRSATSETISRIVVGAAAIALLGIGILWHPPVSLYLLPLAGIAVGGAGLFTAGVGTRRTALGRQLWSASGGFERMLSTPSAKDRFDFSSRKDLYTSYIPYAVAFDCADRWARKYEMTTGSAAPSPAWLGGGMGSAESGGSSGGGDFLSGFESSLASSISAYSATQSSSSSSSSSFSGGGGGGGGGGGSW